MCIYKCVYFVLARLRELSTSNSTGIEFNFKNNEQVYTAPNIREVGVMDYDYIEAILAPEGPSSAILLNFLRLRVTHKN